MLNEFETKQVLALLRDGLSCDEISEQLSIELPLVKLIAARAGAGVDRDITDDDLALLRKHAFNLALGASDDATQARMTMFLLERDKPSKKAETGNSIALINNAIIQANGAFEKLVEEMTKK